MCANNITKYDVFFRKYVENLNISQSCAESGVNRQYFYTLLRTDPGFKEQFEEARQQGIMLLEERAFQRAEQSDALMMFLLRGNLPERYGDKKSINLSGNVTVNMVVEIEGPDKPKL